MPVCSYCGFKNPTNNRFCGECGKPIKVSVVIKNECPLCKSASSELGNPILVCYVAMHCVISDKDFLFYGQDRYFAPNEWGAFKDVAERVFHEDIGRFTGSDFEDILESIGFQDWYIVIRECALHVNEPAFLDFRGKNFLDVIKALDSEDDTEYISLGKDALPESIETILDFKTIIYLLSSANYLANYQIDDEISDFAEEMDIEVEDIPNALKVILFFNWF